MTLALPAPLGGTLFPAGPPGATGAQGQAGPQGASGLQGSAGSQGGPGPAPWATPIPWTSGLICVATAPATAVIYEDVLYICTTSHTTGSVFDPTKWQAIVGGAGGSGYAVDVLTVTATNTVSNLTNVWSGAYAIAFVDGVAYPSNAPTPAFTISGQTLTWSAVNSGKTLVAHTTQVAVLYSTVSPAAVTGAFFLELLTACAQALPTSQPTPGNVWVDGGALALSQSSRSILALFAGDTGAGGAVGIVPAPTAGQGGKGMFLAASGSWVSPTNRIGILCPLDFGAIGDGVTDDTAAIQACLNAAQRSIAVSYVNAELVIDFAAKTYAISATLTATSHPWTTLQNGKLTAVNSFWSPTTYMLDAQGASATSNLGFACYLGFECNRLCSGIAVANAYRCDIQPIVTHELGIGIYVGSNVGLGFIGGICHEVEADDSDFTTYTRVATGIYLDTGAGDVWVDARVGWHNRCIYNGAAGNVHLAGHWYCSSTTVAIYGVAYEQANTGNAIIHDAYIDTGDVLYRGGSLHFASGVRFFHQSGVTPTSLSDHYISAIASSSGQYALLTHDANVVRYDRTVPLVKVNTTSGTWANLGGPILTGNQAVQAVTDPLLVHQMSAVQVAQRFQTPVSGAYLEMYDSATASPPRIGAVGDDLVLWHSSAPRWAALVTGGTNYAFAPWADNVYSAGTAGNRISQLFAGTATINTSDENEKANIAAIPDAVLDAWGDVQWSEFTFKGGKRTHSGLVSQRVAACFTAHGLDPFAYGVICRDEWSASPAVSEPDVNADWTPRLDTEGKPKMREIAPAREAGERWGLRYDEAAALEAAWQRRELARIKAKIGL